MKLLGKNGIWVWQLEIHEMNETMNDLFSCVIPYDFIQILVPVQFFFVICKHLLWKQMSYICPKKGLDPCLKRAFYCDTLLSSARIVQSSWTFWWMITTQWDLSVLIYEVCMIVNAWRRYTWRVSRSICV